MKMKTLNSLFCLTLFALLSFNVSAKSEAEYVEEHCAELGGEAEYILPDNTRVDCLTETDAIEHDFTYKWYECISQALYYRMSTGKQAVCVLIRKYGTSIEEQHIKRARALVKHYNIPVYILELNPHENIE